MSDYAQKVAEVHRLNNALAYALEHVPASKREAVEKHANDLVTGKAADPAATKF